uniref:DRMBL domain-containing protein n=1 Tax=Elaeophora elaphi TaxID=1147741 RepID=A0A0R3S2X1_9BILA
MILSTGQAGLIIDNFIAIDQFGTDPDVKYCFLSSGHSRYCRKLTSKWQSDGIYCSPTTAKLLPVISSRKKGCEIPDKWIRPLDLNVWHKMDGFRVMLIDANHAPGAVMLIIEGDRRTILGRILYTGFFRADARFYQNVIGLSVLQEKKFDTVCIDSTYVDFTGEEFPSRRSSAKEAANLLRMLKCNGVDNVAVSVPIIGRESFLTNLSRELKCRIWLHPERFEIAHILGINGDFSNSKEDTYIWTCSQTESEQVLSMTDSHIIITSMLPNVMSNTSLK